MNSSNGACQTPSKDASRVGNSGIAPKQHNESCFVADEAPGKLDFEHMILASGQLVTVCIETTRYVGTVDPEGFLVHAQQHIAQGTLAPTLLLTVRARISAMEVGGTLGVDGPGRLLEVEAFLHKGDMVHEQSLGKLAGNFGTGSSDWQDFELEVDVWDVKFPDDPCPGQSSDTSCGTEIEPRSNEITFELTGTAWPIVMEVDWLMLEPKDAPGLAWRPVLLVHGLGVTGDAMQAGTAWADGLQARDVAYHAVDVAPRGSIIDNGVEITQAVDDLKRRFGVGRVHVVGHSKGGLDAREHVSLSSFDDVETLIMLGTPNEGSFIADVGWASTRGWIIGEAGLGFMGFLEMTTFNMRLYNQSCARKRKTNYVTAAGDYDSKWATKCAVLFGENDEIVSVMSVEALPYAAAWTYLTSVNDPESQGICQTLNLFNHSCLRYHTRIVDDLFPVYMAVLTPPLPTAPLPTASAAPFETIPLLGVDTATARSPRSHTPAMAATGAVQGSPATGTQGVMSDTGIASGGVTYAHPASIDPVDVAIFLMLGDQDALRFELVSPSGSRIGAATMDPSVTYSSFLDAGPLAYAGYYVEEPEVGGWTLEVTGTGVSSPDGSVYAVAALAPLTPGTGVVLTAAVDQELYAVGGTVTITATITEDGLPVTDATAQAVVAHPDGTTTTEVVLYDDGTNGDTAAGDGQYTGLFTATTDAGLWAIVVSAERTLPAFTREQMLLAPVAQSGSVFSGTVSDHGADTDGDGLYNQLVIDVEVDVDVAAAYRVFGTLTDGAGTTIEQVRAEQELEPGLQTVSLSFDGGNLFALGHGGPYILEDVMLEEVATAIGLDQGLSYTTAAYAHTEFQRPLCLLTGNASDHGSYTDSTGQMPYEALVVEVEVDTLVGEFVQARGKLYSEDDTFVAASTTFVLLYPGLNVLEFEFAATDIFRGGKPGPYTLRLLSLWGTVVSLRVPGVVAVTQPYALEDFAENPRYTVGGTVTGLEGSGLTLRDYESFHDVSLVNDGAFTFPSPQIGGSAYDVRITRQPGNPIQVCSIANGTGAIGTANITDIAVDCVTALPQEGLDPSFGSAGTLTAPFGGAKAMALQSDGKIVVMGGYDYGRKRLARYHSDGSADVSFGTDGKVRVAFNASSVAIQPDGKIVVGGDTSAAGSWSPFALARCTVDGALDPSFGTGGKVTTTFNGGVGHACTVLIQADGKIVIAGHAAVAGSWSGFALARYAIDGTLDPSFGTGGKVTTPLAGGVNLAAAALLQPDGKIVVAGLVDDDNILTDSDAGMVRYTVDGTPDPSFGTMGIVRTDFGLGAFTEATDLALQSDGKLLVVGRVDFTFALARFEANGDLDLNFGSAGLVTTSFSTGDGSSSARAAAIQPDGKIVVVGYANDGTHDDFVVTRYAPDGALDPSFGSDGKATVDFWGMSDGAECVAIQTDGKILVGGSASPWVTLPLSSGIWALVRMLP